MDWGDKTKKFFQENMFFFMVLVICIGYVLLGLVNIIHKDKSILEILADASMSFIMGISIGKLLSLQGIVKGELTNEYVTAMEEHQKKCLAVNSKLARLDTFCRIKTKEAQEFIETNILGAVGICYEDYKSGKYDVEGVSECLSKAQKKALKKVKKLKITSLTTEGLMGNAAPKNDPYNMGDTKEKRLKKEDKKAWLSKTMTAVIFGYFGVQMISEFSWANIIWTAVQVIIFVAGGFGRYMNSYFFVKDDLTIRLKKQDNYLTMFEKWYEENPNYEEEVVEVKAEPIKEKEDEKQQEEVEQ